MTRCRPDGHRPQTIDLRPFLLDAELTDEGTLRARLKVSPDGSARPEELLECLGLRDLLDQGDLPRANPRGACLMTNRTEQSNRRDADSPII